MCSSYKPIILHSSIHPLTIWPLTCHLLFFTVSTGRSMGSNSCRRSLILRGMGGGIFSFVRLKFFSIAVLFVVVEGKHTPVVTFRSQIRGLCSRCSERPARLWRHTIMTSYIYYVKHCITLRDVIPVARKHSVKFLWRRKNGARWFYVIHDMSLGKAGYQITPFGLWM